MSGTSTKAELESAVRAISEESAGLIRTYFIGPQEGASLLVASALGDAWCTSMLGAVAHCMQRVANAPKRSPVLCLCCPRPVRHVPDVIFCVVVPEVGHPNQALGCVICPACAREPGLNARALKGLRAVWPQIRQIEVSPGPVTVQ